MRCPSCQAPSTITSTAKLPYKTINTRECDDCGLGFMSEEVLSSEWEVLVVTADGLVVPYTQYLTVETVLDLVPDDVKEDRYRARVLATDTYVSFVRMFGYKIERLRKEGGQVVKLAHGDIDSGVNRLLTERVQQARTRLEAATPATC